MSRLILFFFNRGQLILSLQKRDPIGESASGKFEEGNVLLTKSALIIHLHKWVTQLNRNFFPPFLANFD